MLYKVIYKDARSMFDALKLAMDRVKQSEQTKPKHSAQNSDIEELKALADLKNQGLITEEEFATMKAKIINK
ncbi:MAG: SHOCT domain-containing protein [Bacteroidales bacterium]|nr:SHOCT domain-containing protein [Bacteroidales bacterium]MBR2474963.1 SHOCT domain-containing protein [Bacteroidaceae bacterium]